MYVSSHDAEGLRGEPRTLRPFCGLIGRAAPAPSPISRNWREAEPIELRHQLVDEQRHSEIEADSNPWPIVAASRHRPPSGPSRKEP